VEHVQAAARHAGIELTPLQLSMMKRYREWLETEGYRAGGIGPHELSRLQRRHLADSLLFAGPIGDSGEVWDLGTGVGLPGVPLAIASPETRFVLVDRSARRIDLLRRVIRILDLQNCEAVHSEINDIHGPVESIVARASLPPERMLTTARRLDVESGRVVIGGSWTDRPRYPGWETIEIPEDVLDHTVWLLIMRRE
jgi:16S rRNA (guanine(527)-N(7))-methyltransferase RsmG